MEFKDCKCVGAIIGDIIGSPYECVRNKETDFPLFINASRCTDDTVMTCAVMDWILDGGGDRLADYYAKWALKYPKAGYGYNFWVWANREDRQPYQSCGNGSAMRCSPVAYAGTTLEEVLELAKKSSMPTHDHIEGIKGAQAVAGSVFMALHGNTKQEIKTFVSETFGYNLERTIDEIRPTYTFQVLCQTSVPEAIIAFLESDCYETAVRNAVSLGGDTDTQGDMAGAIAEAFYGTPETIKTKAQRYIPQEIQDIVIKFNAKIIKQ